MAQEIKVATFNVEWMVNIFENGKPKLLVKRSSSTPGLGAKPRDPQGVANRIASVIQEIDADVLGICEGPPLKAQMEHFVQSKLGGDYTVYSMPDGTQSVHMLIHRRLKGLAVEQLPPTDAVFRRLQQTRLYHKFGHVKLVSKRRFTRKPVILRLKRKGKITEIVTVHTKSKFSELKKPSQWSRRTKAAVISAITARQKLSLEMNEIRKYIAHRLYAGAAESIIVMGDLNDGVSRDIVDDTFLLHSIVHELRGAFHHEIALMRHVLTPAQLQRRGSTWTVAFNDAANSGKLTKVLLDHILYSPKCHEGGTICFVPGSGRIEYAAFDKHVSNRGKTRDERPSDHRPLSARFALL